ASRVLRDGILAAALYGPRGTRGYTAGNGAVTAHAARVDVRAALAGKVVSRVASTGSTPPRVLYTYVPVAIGNRHKRAVVVLAQDFAPITTSARHSTFVVAGVLEGVLLGLLLLLVPPLARASKRIEDQVAELDWLATHDELTGLANRA